MSGNATEKTEAPAKPGGMMVKTIALLFVVAVILAECLIAYIYLPGGGEAAAATTDEAATTPEEPEKPAKEHGKAAHAKSESGHGKGESSHGKSESGHGKKEEKGKGGHGGGEESAGKEDPSGMVEVDLERFSVTAHQPASATTVRMEFHLYGLVRGIDKGEFETLIATSQRRFREQVLVTLRSAEPMDLADAGLGLIKRRILEKTNALLGKPLLQAVVVSDFSYLEQ